MKPLASTRVDGIPPKPFATSHLSAADDGETPVADGKPTRACARPITDGTATLHPLPGDNSTVEPPDPIPNSEVKRRRADGSVAQAMQE